MAIYVTGDCHGDFRRFNMKNFPEQKSMTRDDLIIIAGDCGLIWAKDDKAKGQGGWKEEQHNLQWLESKSFELGFVDGNHENFDSDGRHGADRQRTSDCSADHVQYPYE